MATPLLATLLICATAGSRQEPFPVLIKAEFYSLQEKGQLRLFGGRVEIRRQRDGSHSGYVAHPENLDRVLGKLRETRKARWLTSPAVRTLEGLAAQVTCGCGDGTLTLSVSPHADKGGRMRLSTKISVRPLNDGPEKRRWSFDRDITVDDGKPVLLYLSRGVLPKEPILVVLRAERLPDETLPSR